MSAVGDALDLAAVLKDADATLSDLNKAAAVAYARRQYEFAVKLLVRVDAHPHKHDQHKITHNLLLARYLEQGSQDPSTLLLEMERLLHQLDSHPKDHEEEDGDGFNLAEDLDSYTLRFNLVKFALRYHLFSDFGLGCSVSYS